MASPIAVAFITDENYVDYCATLVTSVVANTSRPVTFYCVGLNLSAAAGRRLATLGTRRGNQLVLLEGDAARYRSLPLLGNSSATYLKLALPELVPSEVSKLIYLDSDCLVTGDLGEIWDLPFDDNLLWAQSEFGGGWGRPSLKQMIRGTLPARLQLDHFHYFNAGVLLINLKGWREQNVAPRALTWLRANSARVCHQDQDGVNIACAGKWNALDLQWNLTGYLFEWAVSARGTLSRQEKLQLVLRQGVSHFTPQKPSFRWWQHPHFADYWYYQCLAKLFSGSRPSVKLFFGVTGSFVGRHLWRLFCILDCGINFALTKRLVRLHRKLVHLKNRSNEATGGSERKAA